MENNQSHVMKTINTNVMENNQSHVKENNQC